MNFLAIICFIVFVNCGSCRRTSTDEFVPYVDETNQPCCVVGAFCMYAKEKLNKEITPQYIQDTIPALRRPSVSVNATAIMWNYLFPTNQLVKIDYDNDPIQFNMPYIWVGKWEGRDDVYHTCLVYFNTNGVMYKNFLYDPSTHTNYMVTTNYPDFFDRTLEIYTLKNELDKK